MSLGEAVLGEEAFGDSAESRGFQSEAKEVEDEPVLS